MRRLNVHIDRLQLRIGSFGDPEELVAAVRVELARQLAQPDVARELMALGHVGRVDAGRIATYPSETPHDTGIRVGRAVSRSLVGGARA